MPQKLIIDADPGIGDALAIAVALSDPDLDVIALTCRLFSPVAIFKRL